MGKISREEARRRIDNPNMPIQRWLDLIEESHEERFAFDADFRRYQAWLKANPQFSSRDREAAMMAPAMWRWIQTAGHCTIRW